MAPMRSAHTGMRVLLCGLLCCAVLMHMLGTPATLWSLDFDSDATSTSVLEGLSLPPDPVTLIPTRSSRPHVVSLFHRPPILFEHILFRPPDRPYSPSTT